MTTCQTWNKTDSRSGEFGNVYESSDGWTIEQILEGKDIGTVSTSYRYTVSHYQLTSPNGDERCFATLASAKRHAEKE